jgi:hypothetical protein
MEVTRRVVDPASLVIAEWELCGIVEKTRLSNYPWIKKQVHMC